MKRIKKMKRIANARAQVRCDFIVESVIGVKVSMTFHT